MITTYASLMCPPDEKRQVRKGQARVTGRCQTVGEGQGLHLFLCLPDLLDNGIAQVPQGKGGVKGDGLRPVGTLVKVGDL
jgi:hypothetical protein